MSDLTSKERPVFVPAVRTPKLPYLCASAECVTCKRPVSGDWGLVPDECDTCDAERRARYYRDCAQWANAEIDRLTAEVLEQARLLGMSAERELRLTARNAELVKALEGLMTYEPEHCPCGYEGCTEVADSWKAARAALKGDATP